MHASTRRKDAHIHVGMTLLTLQLEPVFVNPCGHASHSVRSNSKTLVWRRVVWFDSIWAILHDSESTSFDTSVRAGSCQSNLVIFFMQLLATASVRLVHLSARSCLFCSEVAPVTRLFANFSGKWICINYGMGIYGLQTSTMPRAHYAIYDTVLSFPI